MKRLLCVLLICSVLVMAIGCGENKTVNGMIREPIGMVNILVNDSSIIAPKYADTQYQVCWGNIIWGAILVETVIAPIYFFGFSMFNPIGPKTTVGAER